MERTYVRVVGMSMCCIVALLPIGVKAEERGQVQAVPQLQMREELRTESYLSNLWTVMTLNMMTADVLSLYVPEVRRDFTEFADGKESELMLGGAIFYQIPISMVFLSEVLPYKVNRITNLVASGLVAGAVVAGGTTEPHYVVIATMEVLGLAAIAWKAWTWDPMDEPESSSHALGLAPTSGGGSLSYQYRF